MNLLIRFDYFRISLRHFGNRFRRVEQFQDNIFRDHEKIRHLFQMIPNNYFAYRTGLPRINYKTLSNEEKLNWQNERSKNFEKEIIEFAEKYELESVIIPKFDGTLSIEGTFKNIDEIVTKFDFEFSEGDQEFVTELSKSSVWKTLRKVFWVI